MEQITNCRIKYMLCGGKWEYCGTQFYDMADISSDDECFLRIKLWNDKVYVVRARLQYVEFEAMAQDTLPELKLNFYLTQPIKKG